MSKIVRIAHPAFVLTASIFSLAPLSPAFAQQAAEPAPSAAQELPAVEVVAKKAAPAKKKQATKQAPAKKAAPAQAAATEAAPTSPSPGAPGSGTGPVEDYAAKTSASGTKTDTPLRQTPQSITVVGKEQIRDMGSQSLNETVRYAPGVVADGYGLDIRGDYSLIRGTTSTVFLDGMRKSYGSYTNQATTEPYLLERVEVLRGPASVLYGQGTVGGTIALTTKRPQDETHREVTVEYGTFDFKQIKADMTGRLTGDGKWLYRIVGVARDADTQVDYVENDRKLIAPSLTFRPTSDTSITLLTEFREDDQGSTAQFLPHSGTVRPNVNGRTIPFSRFVGEPGYDRYDTEAQSYSLLFDHKFNEQLSIHHGSRYTDTHNIYASHYTAPLPENFAPGTAPFLDAAQEKIARVKFFSETDTDIFTTDTNLQAKLATGDVLHRFIGGVDYTHYSQDNRRGSGVVNFTALPFAPFPAPFDVYNPNYGPSPYVVLLNENNLPTGAVGPDIVISPTDGITQEQTGVYFQDQLRWGQWIAVLGIRKDWLTSELGRNPSEEEEAVTKRAGLMYEFGFGLTPYVSYSESFNPLPGERILGGGTAKPVEGEQIEAGFKFQPVGRNFSVNAAAYEIKESNRLSPSAAAGLSLQSGEVEIRGFDVELTGQITPNLKAIAGYAYTDAQYVVGPFPAADGARIEGIPEHLASLWAIYTFDTGWLRNVSVGGGIRYVGDTWDGIDVLKTPDYLLFDAMLAYETEDWRWSLNAVNLTNEEHEVACLSRGDCSRGQLRTVITGLTYKF